MIGKWDGFTVGPWGIAGRVVGLLRHGVPQAQVFEYAADDSSVVDDGDDAHGIFTFWAFQRVDFIDFPDKPGPVGFGFVIQRRLVQVQVVPVAVPGSVFLSPRVRYCTSHSNVRGARICQGCGRVVM